MVTDTENRSSVPAESSHPSGNQKAAPETTASVGSHEHDPLCTAKNVQWTFLTNHAHVLLCISRNHHETLREVAECVGITERAVQRIVADLEAAGILKRERQGRKNRYTVDPSRPLRHDLESHATIGDLMNMVLRDQC